MKSSSHNLPERAGAYHRIVADSHATASLDITGIYNRHATAEDAHASAEYIEPGSIVYIEGLNLNTPGQLNTHPLTIHKRLYGQDNDYNVLKNYYLRQLNEQTQTPSMDNEPFCFPEHSTALYHDLIEKDCDIIVADFATRKSFPEEAINILQGNLATSHTNIVSAIQPYTGVGRHVQTLAAMTHKKANMHNLREMFAVRAVVRDASILMDYRTTTEDTPRTSDGKLRAYLVYGTAHTRSLTHKLRDTGITTNAIEVSPISEPEYIDATIESFYNNRLRRIAQTAFTMIEINLMENPSHVRDVVALIYPQMERLNDSPDETIDFCIRCLKIWQYYLSDYDRAVAERQSLINQYLA